MIKQKIELERETPKTIENDVSGLETNEKDKKRVIKVKPLRRFDTLQLPEIDYQAPINPNNDTFGNLSDI